MVDLWPDDITETKLKAPVAILREQASILGQKTQNIVEGEVEALEPDILSAILASDMGDPNETFFYGFYLHAPALRGYRYKVFSMWHDDGLYPVKFDITVDTHQGPNGKTAHQQEVSAKNEDEFLKILSTIFSSQKVRNVVAAIIAQSEGYSPSATRRAGTLARPQDGKQ